MSTSRRRNVALVGSLVLFCSMGFAGWQPLTSGTTKQLHAVHFPQGTQVGYAVGLAGTVLKTTDGGNTWAPESSHTGNALHSVYFKDNNNGFAVGSRGTIITTTDGGTTWAASNSGIHPNDNLSYVSFPSNGQTGYVGVTTDTARVYKSTDGGSSWVATAVGGAITKSTSCAMATDNIGVAIGPNAFAYTTTDGFGTGTFTDAQAVGCIMTAAAFSPTDNNRAYLVGNDTVLDLGIVRFTSNSGSPHWDSARCPVVTHLYDVDYATPETAYVCGDSGFIGGTFNTHDVWKTNTGVTVTINGLSFPGGADTGFAVGANGTILRTYDGGQPWVPAVAEGRAPATLLTGIGVVSNPCRNGIGLRSDANVTVTVFDAVGRAVLTRAATRGVSFLPLRAGAYFVKAGTQMTRAVVTD